MIKNLVNTKNRDVRYESKCNRLMGKQQGITLLDDRLVLARGDTLKFEGNVR